MLTVDVLVNNLFEFTVGLILGIILGFIAGFIYGRSVMVKTKQITTRELEINIAVGVVIFIWTVSTMVEIFSTTYQTPMFLNIVFGAVVGFLLDIDLLKFLKK